MYEYVVFSISYWNSLNHQIFSACVLSMFARLLRRGTGLLRESPKALCFSTPPLPIMEEKKDMVPMMKNTVIRKESTDTVGKERKIERQLDDPLEGPSTGVPQSEDFVAQLRSLYYEEDEETAKEIAKSSGRESGAATFRPIIYDEGELDNSDLSKPPSRKNPHPFDPSTLPPTHSRSLVPYVNTVPLLQILVDMGVDLFEIETKHPAVPRHLLRLPYNEAKLKIQWLLSIGFQPADLGMYLTRNPFVLLQNLDDMKARVNFLASKKFNRPHILKLVSEFRYWLNLDVKTMEFRLVEVTGTFALRKSEMRSVLVKEPRLFMFGLGPIKRIWNLLTNEFRFTPQQVKQMIIEDPRLFMMDSRVIIANFVYACTVMKLPLELIAAHPLLLRVAHSSLRHRHEFLRTLGRAHYDESGEGKGKKKAIIPIADLLVPSDADFAIRVARVTPQSYDIYLRTH